MPAGFTFMFWPISDRAEGFAEHGCANAGRPVAKFRTGVVVAGNDDDCGDKLNGALRF
jgi:hypothetical protein